MSNVITPHTFDKAERLANEGRTLDAWSCLADGGDNYAKTAKHILSFQWSWLNCVRAAHWRIIAPDQPMDGDVWKKIANEALKNYLGFIKANHVAWCAEMGLAQSEHQALTLPTTVQIERVYMLAVSKINAEGIKISPACIIHIAGNLLTTPINKKVEGFCHLIAPWTGPLKPRLGRFYMPDWEGVVGRQFGDLDHRRIHNSDQMAPDSYIHNAYVLALSFICGTIKYGRGLSDPKRRQILPMNTVPIAQQQAPA
jgi:hypothetical protein